MVVRLLDGSFAMPISWDLWAQRGTPARTEGEMDLASGVLKSKDGKQWRPFGSLHIDERKVTPHSTGGVCEPGLVELQDGELYMLLRTGTNFLYESCSRDNGVTWAAPVRSPLVSHNTPAALWRLEDRPGEIIAIWNRSPLNRYPLSVAISGDGGRSWSAPRDVATSDGPQVSYPNITQAADGAIVAVWQAQRKEGGRDIRWARFSRDWVLGK
jgi:predicted neuraminidase